MRVSSLGLLGALLVSSAAMADSPWAVDLGISVVNPSSSSGTLTTGLGDFSTKVSNATAFTPAIEYKFATNWEGELLLANPLSHDVKLTGGPLSDATEVKFKELPPTVSIKYLLSPDTEFSPYVGVGLNYTLVFSVKAQDVLAANNISVKAGNSFGGAGVVGFEYRPKDSQWGVGGDIRYIGIKSDVKLDGTKVGSLDVNPWVYTVGATYHF